MLRTLPRRRTQTHMPTAAVRGEEARAQAAGGRWQGGRRAASSWPALPPSPTTGGSQPDALHTASPARACELLRHWCLCRYRPLPMRSTLSAGGGKQGYQGERERAGGRTKLAQQRARGADKINQQAAPLPLPPRPAGHPCRPCPARLQPTPGGAPAIEVQVPSLGGVAGVDTRPVLAHELRTGCGKEGGARPQLCKAAAGATGSVERRCLVQQRDRDLRCCHCFVSRCCRRLLPGPHVPLLALEPTTATLARPPPPPRGDGSAAAPPPPPPPPPPVPAHKWRAGCTAAGPILRASETSGCVGCEAQRSAAPRLQGGNRERGRGRARRQVAGCVCAGRRSHRAAGGWLDGQGRHRCCAHWLQTAQAAVGAAACMLVAVCTSGKGGGAVSCM